MFLFPSRLGLKSLAVTDRSYSRHHNSTNSTPDPGDFLEAIKFDKWGRAKILTRDTAAVMLVPQSSLSLGGAAAAELFRARIVVEWN